MGQLRNEIRIILLLIFPALSLIKLFHPRLLVFTFLILFVSITSVKVNSQTFHVSGNVSTSSTPVSYASVTFINENDTTKKYSTITDTSGNYQIDIVTSVKEEPVIPQSIELAQNYPNPFSSETEIPYKLNKESDVSIKIYNILGQEVKTFRVGLQTNGVYGVRWDGRNNFGSKVTTGIYFYQLQTGNETLVKKMIFGVSGINSSASLYRPVTAQTIDLEKVRSYVGQTFLIQITNTDNTEPKIMSEELGGLILRDTMFNFVLEKVKDEILYIKDTGDPLNCAIYLMDIDKTYHKKITDSVYAYGIARWSPDGNWIAYEGAYNYWENYEVYVVKADGEGKYIITISEPFHEGGTHPIWSPDGKQIAFSKCINCELGGLNYEIFIRDFDTTGGVKETRLTNNLFGDKAIDWSPDGSKILFRSNFSIDSTYDFYADWYIMNPDGTSKERIYANDSSFFATDMRYSPDGNMIAVSTLEGTYIMDKDGAHFRRISDVSGDSFSQISWSPDGKYLLSGGVFIINTDGSGYKDLLISREPNNYSSPDWRPKME